MANFEQHLKFAASISGILSTTLLGADLINPYEAFGLWVVGTAGGILPDIDSDNSTVLNIIFGGLCLGGIALLLNQLSTTLSTLEIWGAILLFYIMLYHIIRRLFENHTIHRGIFHSILSGCFFGCTATAIAFHLLHLTDTLSWWVGSFLLLGFLTHLILDELYSVDFMNVRVKRSFGTALKLVAYNNWTVSLIMTAATLFAFFLTPDPQGFSHLISSKDTYLQLKTHFLP